MYKDEITSQNIVSLYILMNKKTKDLYENIFLSVKKMITQNYEINLSLKLIISKKIWKFHLKKTIIIII